MKNKKHITISILTPLESYVYSKLGFNPLYDSFGVERVYKRVHFYKHAILLGLGVINVISYLFFIKHAQLNCGILNLELWGNMQS